MSAANNFSLIRLGAAFAVVISHSTVLVGKPQLLTGTTYATLGSLAVDVFFAVSGSCWPRRWFATPILAASSSGASCGYGQA